MPAHLRYAMAFLSQALLSKYPTTRLQEMQSKPRTRPVLWSWSTLRRYFWGGLPQIAHTPPCFSNISSYCPISRPYTTLSRRAFLQAMQWPPRWSLRRLLRLNWDMGFVTWQYGQSLVSSVMFRSYHNGQTLSNSGGWTLSL